MINAKCLFCKKEFATYPCRIKIGWGKYCTKKCRTDASIGKSPWNKGTVGMYSEEYREKISNSKKERIKKGDVYTKDFYRKIGLLGSKSLHDKKETGIEKKVYEELKNLGLFFEKQFLINGRFLVDAWIPSLNLIVEADGKYWHSLERVSKKDKKENLYLKKCGFNVLRLSEEEINNGNFKERLVI